MRDSTINDSDVSIAGGAPEIALEVKQAAASGMANFRAQFEQAKQTEALKQQERQAFEQVKVEQQAALDLTSHGVLGHFAKSTRNVQLLTFLLALDRVDRWAIDFNEDQSAKSFEIQLFMQDLQRFVDSSLSVLHRVPEEFAEILAHLTTTRCMYLIRFVGQRNEEFLETLGFLLEEGSNSSPSIAAVRRRLEAFSKAQLLGEIFSGKRLTRINRIMGSYSDV